jgi:hypothetical protein
VNITDIEINRLQGSKILGSKLSGIEVQILIWFLRQLELQGKFGHNLDDEKFHSNATIAAQLGFSKETVRRHKESLHARGILMVDGTTWGAYQKNGYRRKTGRSQHIKLSIGFQKFLLDRGAWSDERKWLFEKPAKFVKKEDQRKVKQREATIRWYLRYQGLQGPMVRAGSVRIGSLFADEFSTHLNMIATQRSMGTVEMGEAQKKSMLMVIKAGRLDFDTCMRHLMSMGYARTHVEAKKVLNNIVRTG